MAREKRQHNAEFKARIAIEAIRGRYSIKEIATNFGLNPSLVHAWKQQFLSSAAQLFRPVGADAASGADRHLDRKIRELTAEQEWMRGAAGGMKLRDKRSCVEPENPEVSILAQARLLGLHRSGIYYKSHPRDKNHEHAAREESMANETSQTANAFTAAVPENKGESHVC